MNREAQDGRGKQVATSGATEYKVNLKGEMADVVGLVRALRTFLPVANGYLLAAADELLKVLYVGKDEEEAGLIYARGEGTEGWIATDAVTGFLQQDLDGHICNRIWTGAEIGALIKVKRSFVVPEGITGYLNVAEGDVLRVVRVGIHGDEKGWLVAKRLTGSPGWVPAESVNGWFSGCIGQRNAKSSLDCTCFAGYNATTLCPRDGGARCALRMQPHDLSCIYPAVSLEKDDVLLICSPHWDVVNGFVEVLHVKTRRQGWLRPEHTSASVGRGRYVRFMLESDYACRTWVVDAADLKIDANDCTLANADDTTRSLLLERLADEEEVDLEAAWAGYEYYKLSVGRMYSAPPDYYFEWCTWSGTHITLGYLQPGRYTLGLRKNAAEMLDRLAGTASATRAATKATHSSETQNDNDVATWFEEQVWNACGQEAGASLCGRCSP